MCVQIKTTPGSRHKRVRHETYGELHERARAQVGELDTVREQLDLVMAALRDDGERSAAEVLAEVMLESIDESSGDADHEGREEHEVAEPTPRVSPRACAGRELRNLLLEVNRALRLGKTKLADAKLDALEDTSAAADAKKRPGTSIVSKRAAEIRDLVFKIGGLALTRRALDRFMSMPEVKQLLPHHLLLSGRDARTGMLLLDCGRDFFTKLMATRGRRCDEDANAVLAGAAALLPHSLFGCRRGRSAMRILGMSYRVAKKATAYRAAKKATAIRGEMDDRGRGWRRVESAKHKDTLDIAPICDWWHTADASSEDNNNKRPVRIYLGEDAETGEQLYDIHWVRHQHGTNAEALAAFQRSTYAQVCKEQTKTPKRPGGIIPGLKTVVAARCPCVKARGRGECDCDICTVVYENLVIFHKAQRAWWVDAEKEALLRSRSSTNEQYYSCTATSLLRAASVERALAVGERRLAPRHAQFIARVVADDRTASRVSTSLSIEARSALATAASPPYPCDKCAGRCRAWREATASLGQLEAYVFCEREKHPNYSTGGST